MAKKALVRIAPRTPSGDKRYPFWLLLALMTGVGAVQQTNHLHDQQASYFSSMASNAEHNCMAFRSARCLSLDPRTVVPVGRSCFLLHCDRHTAHGGRNFSADPGA